MIELPVKLEEAALGAKIDLPTPHGEISVTIPAGSPSGKSLRFKGMGIRPEGKPRGDLIAELRIVLPAELNPAQRAAIESFAAASDNFDPREKLTW